MKKIFSLFMLMLLMAGFSAKAENEIYAVFDPSVHCLTLYYDDQKESRGGVTDWGYSEYMQQVTWIDLDESMKNARPTSTERWFAGYSNVTKILHLEYLNTSEVADMSQMFLLCSALTTLDLRNFDITNVTNMLVMFSNCTNLTTIYCGGNWSTTTALSTSMFNGCTSLVGGNGTTYDPNHTDASYARLDEPGAEGYFSDKSPEIYALYDDATTTMTLYYDEKREDNNGFAEWWDDLPYVDVTTVILDESMKDARPTSTSGWFYYFTQLREIQHLDYLNTSEVIDMSIMFRNCERLTSLDLRSFDVTNVTNMRLMFYDCSALKTIYCSGNWTATTADTEDLFKGCTSIVGGNGTPYDPNHIDASYARLDEPGTPGYFALEAGPEIYALYDDFTATMTLYFNNQREEKGGTAKWSEDLPYGDVMTVVLDESMKNARPRSTKGWFYYFVRLREIQHLEYLNTSEVTDMSMMFRHCEKLTTLDVRSLDITKVTDISGMFMECSALKTIYCNGDWSTTTADTEFMFTGCTSIVGGNGTTYDADHTDGAYARYDEPGAPGYFTVNTTGIEQITPSGSPSRGEKVLLNGELYILRGEEIFNAQGGRVK